MIVLIKRSSAAEVLLEMSKSQLLQQSINKGVNEDISGNCNRQKARVIMKIGKIEFKLKVLIGTVKLIKEAIRLVLIS